MSPEQARGKVVDYRTDIFSLGVVLYEMLTGFQPFYGETNSDVIAAILMKEPDNPRSFNPKIPCELEKIVLKTLSKNPENRYQTAKELLLDLKNLKFDLDFEQRTNKSNQLAERLSPETKTEILEAQTGKIDRVITQPIHKNFSSRIPFIHSTKISDLPVKYKFTFALIPFFVALFLIIFFFYPTFSASYPPPAAVKLYEEGVEALREGTFYKAGKLLEESVKTDNNYTKARAALAEAWMELDYFGRAQTEILKINELEKKNQSFISTFYKSDESLYLEAVNATVLRDFPKAVNSYQKLTERNPNSPHAFLDLGRAYEKNEEIDKAFENYAKAAELNPQYGAAFLRIGVLQRRKAEYEKSNQSFDTAEQIFDRQSNDEAIAEVRLQRGISLNLQEKTDDARFQFEQVFNMPRANNHQKIRALLQISSSCAGEGKTDCAEQYAANAVKMAKDERMENVATSGLIDLGNAFLARGDYEKSEQNFQQALDFARKDEGLRNEARALLSLASLRIQQKKPDEADAFTQQAIPFFQKGNYNKELAQANLILGRACEMRADFDAALKFFEQVENAENAAVTDRAYSKLVSGVVLLKVENYPAALRKFEQSYDLYKSLNSSFYMTHVLFYLSSTSISLGRFEDAQNYLKQAEGLLKEGDSLLPQLKTRKYLVSSQTALSRQNFAEAIKEAKLIDAAKSVSDALSVNLILCSAQTLANPKNLGTLQSCYDAVKFAEETKDLKTINYTKLILSKAYLNTGDFNKSLETALATKDYFINKGIKESLWKTWVIAATASNQAGNKTNAKEFAIRAIDVLNQIKAEWGEDNFNIYLSNPEINILFKQAENLAQS